MLDEIRNITQHGRFPFLATAGVEPRFSSHGSYRVVEGRDGKNNSWSRRPAEKRRAGASSSSAHKVQSTEKQKTVKRGILGRRL